MIGFIKSNVERTYVVMMFSRL